MNILNNMPLKTKLPLMVLMSALITGTALTTVNYFNSEERLHIDADVKLQSALVDHKKEVVSFLEKLENSLHSIHSSPSVIGAIRQFDSAWNDMKAQGLNPEEYVTNLYVNQNSNAAGEKYKLTDAGDGSAWSKTHVKFHPWLTDFVLDNGYYDLFLVNKEGEIIYTMYKEPDFATNLKTGKWSDTDLASAFRKAMEAASEDATVLTDLKAYAPSNGVAASFMGSQVRDEKGEVIGAIFFQMPVGLISDLVKEVGNLGETGEIALYGEDMLMRSDGRFTKKGDTDILKTSVVFEEAKNAFSTEESKASGLADAVDSKGAVSRIAYDKVNFAGLTWGIVAEIDSDEIFAPIYELRNQSIMIGFGIVGLVSVLGLILARNITRKIEGMSNVMDALSKGDVQAIPCLNQEDEIGAMAHSLSDLKDSVVNITRMTNAMNVTTSNIMIADENYNIIYVNDSVKTMLRRVEKDLQKELPQFAVDKLVGSNIDIFHKNPAHQRTMLDKLSGTYKSSLMIAGIPLDIIANPIVDKQGKRIGTVTEWSDNGVMMGTVAAIDKSQASIEFNTDGIILKANDNFLHAMSYSMDEIRGKHHSMFVEPAYAASVEYRQFWDALNRGEYQAAEYKRIGKGGKEVWIQASYNPILNLKGQVVRVVKYATETTQRKLQNADYAGQIEAIGKSQAVIEFHMDGTIISANNNFLDTLGYSLDEIKGKHHAMFVETVYKNSVEYKQFWDALNRGEYQSAEYKRIGKGGKEVWIQASYNPILDLNGKPFKVVKYATNVTEMVKTRMENERGMNEAVDVLEGLAGGDLTQTMNGHYDGTFGDIKKSLNATVEKLIEVVVNIKEATDSVNSAASEIASGSQDLSTRTENQASSLEETAASMEELTGTVQSNAENSKQANDLSLTARQVAEKGGEVVNTAIEAMGRIEGSSQKIADIIGVIDEIAFQTNLLALNAAVEAARAGEAGKGFAVVASEVRSLAGRSASASKEIKALIQESVGQVKTGSQLVNQTGTTLGDIVSSVNKVADIIASIAEASREQSSGISEINTAVAQMDEMTQQNAALVEETTAAAQSLAQKGIELNQLISYFRVDESESSSSSAPRRAMPVATAVHTSSGSKKKPASAPKKLASSASAKSGGGKGPSGDGWEEF